MIVIKRAGFVSVMIVILALLCMAAPAMAATWVVNPDGTGDFTTIQAAFDSEWTSGDTIEIAYAVYQEPVAVNADGRDLTITGIPSPVGNLPVIDGMNGAIELPGLIDGWLGCGECSMYLVGGSFDISCIKVTNASHNGLVVDSYFDGTTLQVTDVEAIENGRHGINIFGYDEVVLTGIEASDNGWRGVNMWLNWDSTVQIEDILVMDNGRDGLMVGASGFATADISRVESNGNGYEGVVLNGLKTFTVSEMLLDGNGVEQDLPLSLSLTGCGNAAIEEGVDRYALSPQHAKMNAAATEYQATISQNSPALRGEGNGLFVVNCGNGTISEVEATNNPAVGIMVDASGDVVISDSTASGNGYLGILTMSVSDEYPLFAELIADIDADMDSDEMTDALDTFFTGMSAVVANSTVVSEDEFMLGENVFIFVENVTEDGPDMTLTSVSANENGYAGIGVLAPYVNATDITTDGNGVFPTDVAATLAGAGIVGASFVGEYSGVDAADNGGAGMAAASLLLDIEDATLTGNGEDAFSDAHGPLFQTGLLTVSLVNFFSGVNADQNAGSGILMTSVITFCDECSASGNDYAGIVTADPLSLGIAALLLHSDLSGVLDSADISEEDRFYLESLSTPAMQDVMTCYGETDTFVSSAAADLEIEIDDVTEEDVAVLIEMLHQYMGMSACVMFDSAADDNGLFGLAAVCPNVAAFGFSADDNGNEGGSPLEALLGTGIFGLYLNGAFYDTSVSENTGAGMVTVGVVSEYNEVTADNNGYAGIVTIDPVTLAAAALGAYFVVLDDNGAEVDMTAADTTEMADIDMHADIAESAVVQEIVSTYYTGTASADAAMDSVILPNSGMEILLEHIEIYYENAGVYATDVSASGNGYPGFVAIGPNVMMDGVTADNNGAANDDESEIIALAAGSGVIGLSLVGDYYDIGADDNSGAGIATAGVVTDMTGCEADDNGVGVVSLFIVGDCTEIMADENAGPGIVLAGINGTLTDSVAIENAGPGILCVDPVATALMYLVPVMSVTADDAETVSPETMALLSQLSGDTTTASSVSEERETAWTLIEWAIAHASSYEGDISDLNETEIVDLLLTHYLAGAEMSVSDVVADDNGWQGIVILSPSIAMEEIYAEGNGYHGVSVISPWKAVDAAGWEHPAEPVGSQRLNVENISAVMNGGAGLAVAGANGGFVGDVYGSENVAGLLLGNSDQLLVTDTTFETNWLASVACGGNELNSLIPMDLFLSDGMITDPTGSCDNVFVYTDVDAGIVVLTNSSGNVFADSSFDETAEIVADISGDGPFILYSTSGYWAPVLPETHSWVHMAGCGIGVSGMGGFNTTVNVTYDYSYGFTEETGAGLYPMWTVNATTPWDSWSFNPVSNDKVAMTVGPMEVPVCCPATVPVGEVTDLMYIAPFWQEERSNDDPGHDAFMESLAENKHGYLNAYGVFVPYKPGEAPGDIPGDGTGDDAGDDTGDITGDGSGDDTGDDTGDRSGDETGSSQQSDAGGNTPAAAGVTATATATPVPTTTPAGVAPVIGALGILGLLAVIRRR